MFPTGLIIQSITEEVSENKILNPKSETIWKKLRTHPKTHLISYYFCKRFVQLFANYIV